MRSPKKLLQPPQPNRVPTSEGARLSNKTLRAAAANSWRMAMPIPADVNS